MLIAIHGTIAASTFLMTTTALGPVVISPMGAAAAVITKFLSIKYRILVMRPQNTT
jgi:hypothetical protein